MSQHYTMSLWGKVPNNFSRHRTLLVSISSCVTWKMMKTFLAWLSSRVRQRQGRIELLCAAFKIQSFPLVEAAENRMRILDHLEDISEISALCQPEWTQRSRSCVENDGEAFNVVICMLLHENVLLMRCGEATAAQKWNRKHFQKFTRNFQHYRRSSFAAIQNALSYVTQSDASTMNERNERANGMEIRKRSEINHISGKAEEPTKPLGYRSHCSSTSDNACQSAKLISDRSSCNLNSSKCRRMSAGVHNP